MTRFIDSVSTHQLLPPYQSENSVVHCFLFEVGVQAIQRFCDTFLNLGDQSSRPFLYKAISAAPFGMLSITNYPRMCSLDQQVPKALGVSASRWDHLSQTEFFVAVPVHRYQVTPANLMVDPVIQWVQPIIVTDNATFAFSSREILGLDALYGHIKTQPTNTSGGSAFAVSLPSWKIFAPNSPEEMLPFVSIDRGPSVSGLGGDGGKEVVSLFNELEAAIPDLADIAEGRFPETLELVILKQFRSAADATQAIYQALITCQNRYSNVSAQTFFDPAAVTIKFESGAMVDEILGSFLNVRSTTGWKPVAIRPGRRLRQPFFRSPRVKMAFSFNATIDLMNIKSQFNFRRVAAA